VDRTELVKNTTSDFLQNLGVSGVEIEVNYDKSNDRYLIVLKTEQPGSLIGYHGNTLSGMQTFISQHLRSKTGEWINLSLDVNDYKERREQNIKSLADDTVERVLSTGQAHILPPMTAFERRVVHLYLAEHPDVSTESQGEGRQRSVIIYPK